MRIIKDTYPQLFDFQKEGVDFLANHRSALLADQLGIGKSAQAIHAAQQVGARSILVICPASIKYNWRKEGVKWGYSEDDIYIIDRGVKTLPETGMFIINYDLIWRKKYVKLLAKREYDVLICDECHHVKNHRAKRSKAVWLKDGYCDKSIYRWMLTATPVLNRPVELHPMLSKLCPKRLGEYKNYIDYTRRYCRGHDGNWGWNATGADNLQELSGRLTGFMLRRTRDCLPDKTLQKIYMPTTKEIEKQLFSGNETDSIRRKIGIGKIKPSVEHIKNILEDEDKVIVFAFHRDVIEGLEEELKEYNPVKLYGSTSQKERQKSINKFSTDDETRVFIGQIHRCYDLCHGRCRDDHRFSVLSRCKQGERVMNWTILWQIVLIFTLIGYSLMATIVLIGGIYNIRDLLRDLSPAAPDPDQKTQVNKVAFFNI